MKNTLIVLGVGGDKVSAERFMMQYAIHTRITNAFVSTLW